MPWNNAITQRFQIKYPFIQAPMLGITTPAMVAAVSNSGGLGSLPIGGLAPAQAVTLIREVKALTDQPFAVNRSHMHPLITILRSRYCRCNVSYRISISNTV